MKQKIIQHGSGIYFVSGDTVWCERFSGGKLCGKYWNAAGVIDDAEKVPDCDYTPESSFNFTVDGQTLDSGWELVSIEKSENSCSLNLRNTLRKIDLSVITKIGDNRFFQRYLEIVNRDNTPVALGELRIFSGLLQRGAIPFALHETVYELGRFSAGGWEQEGRFRWQKLENATRAGLQQDNRFGASGHSQPWFLLRRGDSNEYFAFYLGWSGNWSAELYCETVCRNYLEVSLGPTAPSYPQRMIAPAEKFTTPTVHIGHLRGSLDDMVNAAARHIRSDVMPKSPVQPWPVAAANSYSCHLQAVLSEARVLEDIDRMYEVGCEAYTVDCGWFGSAEITQELRKRCYYAGMGDWTASSDFPHGMKYISDYVHSKGMLFALWFEPENVHINCDNFKNNPDWFLPADANSDRRSWNFTLPEVQKHLEELFCMCIADYGIDIFRIDAAPSRPGIGEIKNGAFLENIAMRHYEFFYSLLEKLRREFPKLLIENCCGGGGRMDLGILSHAHWNQASDAQGFPRDVDIINGISMMLPPEAFFVDTIMPSSKIGAFGDTDRCYRIRLFCNNMNVSAGTHPGSDGLCDLQKRYIELWKNFVRPRLIGGNVFHHTPELGVETVNPEPACILEYASACRHYAMVGAFAMMPGEKELRIRPRGISSDGNYKILSLEHSEVMYLPGTSLVNDGISVRLSGIESSEVFIIEPV